MNRFLRLSQILGVNAVPVLGVAAGGWQTATALVLYWCETILLVLLVALRIHLHRRATKKRGHYCEMLVRTTTNGSTRTKRSIGHFGTSFLALALLFSFGQAVFLAVVINRDDSLRDGVNVVQLRQGLAVTAVLLVVGLFIDLVGIRARPFAWIRDMSTAVLWRVFLVQIVVIAGVVGAAWLELPRITLLTFVALKVYTDLASQLPQYNPEEAPRWMGSDFARYWRTERKRDEAREAAEEEVFDGRPMPLDQTLIRRTDG
jgi:hypothetical protein